MNPKASLTGLVAVLLLTTALAGCQQLLDGDGTASIFVKDATTDEFRHVNVTFTKVEIHRGDSNESEDGDQEPDTSGDDWITAFEGQRTIDLLDFDEDDSRAFLGQANLSQGTYNQILVTVDSATGVKDDGSEVTFTVTTGWFRFVRAWNVRAGQNTGIIVDVDLDQAIVKQGNNQYRFNPRLGDVQASFDASADGPGAERRDTGTEGGTDGGGNGTGSQTTYVKDVPPGDHFDELWVEFDRVEVHAASNASWVTTINTSTEIDLLRFNETGSKAFLGESTLDAGRYTQIRINVTDAWGIDKNGSRVNVTVPSGVARVPRPFNVSANQTTQVVIDLDLDQSLKKTSGGQNGGQGDQGQPQADWKLTPVIGKVLVDESAEDDPRSDVPDSGE